MEKLDCKGLGCPEPVIRVKKALKDNDKVKVKVDNQTAVENITRMAVKQGYQVEEIVHSEKEIEVYIYGKKSEVAQGKTQSNGQQGKVYLFTSPTLGEGPVELGQLLLEGMLKTIGQLDQLPDSLIFMNEGVKLVTENDKTSSIIKKLEERGISIFVCGTCLEYFDLKDSLQTGQISNMYEIMEKINGYATVHI
ncbi:MAG: sulfurtransferase-like selenium metabolism protein YedF [Bacillota bacterium]